MQQQMNNPYNLYPYGLQGYPAMYPQMQQPQVQQIAQPIQNPSLPGRIVQDVSQVAPNEVPMNGSMGYFPLADNSGIFAKFWNRDGIIETVKYIPEVQQAGTKTKEDVNQEMLNRLTSLEQIVSEMQTTFAKLMS